MSGEQVKKKGRKLSSRERVVHGNLVSTGATSGIGKETARVLAKKGAHVIMAIRNLQTGEELKSAIKAESPKARVDVMKLDLGSVASVRQFADEFLSRKFPLNVLMYEIFSLRI